MAKTVIHLPAEITARSQENKKRIYGWSRQRLKHMLSKNNAYISYLKTYYFQMRYHS